MWAKSGLWSRKKDTAPSPDGPGVCSFSQIDFSIVLVCRMLNGKMSYMKYAKVREYTKL